MYPKRALPWQHFLFQQWFYLSIHSVSSQLHCSCCVLGKRESASLATSSYKWLYVMKEQPIKIWHLKICRNSLEPVAIGLCILFQSCHPTLDLTPWNSGRPFRLFWLQHCLKLSDRKLLRWVQGILLWESHEPKSSRVYYRLWFIFSW